MRLQFRGEIWGGVKFQILTWKLTNRELKAFKAQIRGRVEVEK